MTVAVALQTCGREAYTEHTLRTFAACNPDRSRFVLVHGDDASESRVNLDLAEAHGFQTVYRSSTRRGWLETRRKLLHKAAKRAPWILLLENDIESLRAFPWALFDFVRQDAGIYCLRLYGRFKDREKTEQCLATHKRRGHMPVDWRPLRWAPESAQIGDIHWSAQPCVTQAEPLVDHHRTGLEPGGLTARVKKNVMAHFGVARTAPPLRVAC